MIFSLAKKIPSLKPAALSEHLEKRFNLFIESHSQQINIVTITPDNKLVITSSEKELRVWCNNTNQTVSKLSGHSQTITCLEASSDYLLSGSKDLTIRIWDLHSMAQFYIQENLTQVVVCLALSHDNLSFASGSQEGEVKLYDFKAKSLDFTQSLHDKEIKFLKLSKNSPILFSASASGFLIATNVLNKSKVYSKRITDGYLLSAYLSPNEELFLSCSLNDPKISLWNLDTMTCTHYSLPNRLIDSKVILSSGNRDFIYATKRQSLVSFSLSQTQPPQTLISHSAKISDFTSSSNTIFSVSHDHSLKKFSTLTGQTHTFNGHTLPITYFKFDPKHNLLFTSGLDATIRLWNLSTKSQEQVFNINNSFVNYLSISTNPSLCLANCGTHDLILCDLQENTQKRFSFKDFPRFKSTSISNSKKYLIALCPGTGTGTSCFVYKLSILLSL